MMHANSTNESVVKGNNNNIFQKFNLDNNQQTASKHFIQSGIINNLAYKSNSIKNSSISINSKISNKILLSDDEDSWDNNKDQKMKSPTEKEWLDRRKDITSIEKENNRKLALEQRKLLSNTIKTKSIISKKPKLNYNDSDDDDFNPIISDSIILKNMELSNILKQKSSFKSDLLNNTFNDKENKLFEMQVNKAQSYKQQRNERVQKRNTSPMIIENNIHNHNIKAMWNNVSNKKFNDLDDSDTDMGFNKTSTEVRSNTISIDNSTANKSIHKQLSKDHNSDGSDSDIQINRNQKRNKSIVTIIQSPDYMELIDSDDPEKTNNVKHENKLRKNNMNLLKVNNTQSSNFIDLVGTDDNKNGKIKKVMQTKTNLKSKQQIIKKRQIASSSSNNSSDHSSDNSDSCQGEDINQLNRKDIQAQAHVILNKCKDYSGNLRASLIEWETGGESSSNGIKNNLSNGIKQTLAVDKDCIDLTSIKSPVHSSKNKVNSCSQILYDEDIRVVCPGLILKSYQLVGINWLKLLHENHVNGVLADDMGLGKTVQTISFLGWLNSTVIKPHRSKPHLIVVPASTLTNWQNELRKFCPSFEVAVYHGSQQERMELRYMLRNPHSNIDVILSTYTIFERESNKSDRSFMYSLEFEYLVLDEAHCIKNADSSRYNNLNALKTNHRLLLSGTPVQNDIGELLSMLSFLMPKVFGRRNRELLIEALNLNNHKNNNTLLLTNNNNKKQPQEGELSLLQLRSILAPFVLRRLKKHVLDQLSDKITIVKRLTMTTFQKEVYDNILLDHTARKDFIKLKQKEIINNESILNGKNNKTNNKESKQDIIDLTTTNNTINTTKVPDLITKPNEILKKMSTSEANHLFTALRKVANHPLLLRVRYQDNDILERIATVAYHNNYFGNQCDYQRVRDEIDLMSDFDIHYLCLEYSTQLSGLELIASVLYDSPKMDFLKNFLPQLKNEGHRMLIFSQWTRLLDLLEVLMQDIGFLYLRLDGATPVKERQDLIDQFSTQENIPVFLLSTKAGGLGINLTSADTVILHDLGSKHFNPENDKQAEDRCHRIGQMKPVTIYKLYAEETVDEDIYEMGERKSKLSKAVLADDDNNHSINNNKSPINYKNKNEMDDTYLISNILQKALLRKLSQV